MSVAATRESRTVKLIAALSGAGDPIGINGLREADAQARLDVAHLHEHILLRIGTRVSLVGLLDRFGARCELHDRDRLLSLTKDKQPERALKRELIIWLFDQGLNPMPEADVGGLRADVLDPGLLLVEAKRYSRANRDKIITGVRQLRDHARKLAGTKHFVAEACYVVFREGGPIYQLPPEIHFGGITIVPTMIDLGPNHKSGSRQREKVDVIELTEFFERPG